MIYRGINSANSEQKYSANTLQKLLCTDTLNHIESPDSVLGHLEDNLKLLKWNQANVWNVEANVFH